jgi:uncharacterized protein
MPHPVVHFEVVGKDGNALRRYFSDLFGWEFEVHEELKYGIVPREEPGIGGGVGESDEASYATFYVQVDDVQGSLDKAVELGGTAVMGPMDIPMGPTIAMFHDPEGHPIGLVSPPPEGAPS